MHRNPQKFNVQCVQKLLSDCRDLVIFEVFEVKFLMKNIWFAKKHEGTMIVAKARLTVT